MAQPDKVGEVRIEEVARKETEPLILAIHIVDRDGKYFGHLFKKPQGFDADIRVPIFEGLWDYDGELTRAKKRVAELECEVERLRVYPEAVKQIRACYPESVFLPNSRSLDAKSAWWARKVCDNIVNKADELRHERIENGADTRTGEGTEAS